MRGRGTWMVAGLALLVLLPAAARAQEGASSPTVEFVRHVPFDVESAIASQRLGRYLYLTGTRAISIYDVEDPVDPELVSHVPLGYEWQNEDVSTNGRILLVSESLPGDILHVWDVSDPSLPREISRVLFAGNHTSECLHDCTWSYGSEGDIVDLRDPAAPVLAGNWMEAIGFDGGAHDVNEVRPGLVAVATLDQDFLLLDTEDPLHPHVVGGGPHPDPESYILHQVDWPRDGADRLAIASGEGGDGPIISYRALPGRTFEVGATYTLGTTSHWFDVHPRFRDGGLIAVGWYGEGTRILRVDPDGALTEVGHYDPSEGALLESIPPDSTWAARWVSDDIVYAIDNARGIDILRWVGGIPEPPPAPVVPPQPAAPAPAAVTAPPAVRRLRVRGRRITFRLTHPGRVTLAVLRRGRRVRVFALDGRAGVNRARLPRLRRGTYRLVATPRSGAPVRVRVRVRRS